MVEGQWARGGTLDMVGRLCSGTRNSTRLLLRPADVLRWLFFATLSLILLIQLRGFDESLRGDDTPYPAPSGAPNGASGGIVGYELAWSASRANEYLSAWRASGALETAKVSLGVDFAFLLAYPLMFATGAALLVRKPVTSAFDRFGRAIQRAVLLCIPLDAIENLALWRMIDHGASDALAHLATICAAIKFLLVIAAALWCVSALARRIGSRQPAQR